MLITVDFNDQASTAASELAKRRSWRFRQDSKTQLTLGNYGRHSCNTVALHVQATKTADTAQGTPGYRVIRRGKGQASSSGDDCFLITVCQLDEDADADFVAQFDRASRYLSEQAGCVRFRLLESVSDDAPYRFINIAQWRSVPAFEQAFASPEFQRELTGGFDVQSQVILANRVGDEVAYHA